MTVSLPRVVVAMVAAATLVGCGTNAPAGSPTVPDVVGQTLDIAKTTLQTAGFDAAPQDLLRGRNQLLDSDWTVCTQSPGPVPSVQGATVDLGVVKKAETCPTPAATARPTTAAARTTTTPIAAPAVGNPKPRPAPKPQSQPKTQAEAAPASDDTGPDNSGSGVGTVRPGTFCDPPGTGVSAKGKPMVCAPAADGRNRWQSA
jgi:hypothetical protein